MPRVEAWIFDEERDQKITYSPEGSPGLAEVDSGSWRWYAQQWWRDQWNLRWLEEEVRGRKLSSFETVNTRVGVALHLVVAAVGFILGFLK